MPKEKKDAKMGHNKPKAAMDSQEQAAAKLVAVTGSHRFVIDGQGRTACGRRSKGWRYGTAADVTCADCA